ncbi:Zn-dependent oligopeptidase [Myxococcus sp. CA056]|uniref:M3 family metallopeptidase n=1 Tax=Myxococcus sp. CA056 TaxID=2741740 RepID=UPI00157BAB5B|nr:M3 family metallopeptidase [Myxococcus sp. CA056]NTX15330.1 Zn-dependent oligopeptidase [Myxococcus sp. CA056]
MEACRRDIQEARGAVARLTAPGARRLATQALLTTYDDAVALLDDAVGRSGIGANVHPDGAFRAAAERCEQAVERVRTDISLDRRVYDVLASLELEGQDALTRRWVARVLKGFQRAGVDRDEATRERVRVLQEELIVLGQEFSRHIHEDVRHLDVAPSALAGLPEDYVRAHPPGPDGRVRLATDSSDLGPFMTYARDTAAREALWRLGRRRGHPRNLDTLARMLQARHALATLLGYPSWAAYAAEDKMVRRQQVAADFIEELAAAVDGRMRGEYATLLARKREQVPDATHVEPWEQAWLEDRVRAEQYRFDSRELRPYFEYTRVKQGVLDLTASLFGLTYRRVPDAPVWHPDVEVWDVYEGTERRGRFYLDMHPRPGKYTHAAQWDLAMGRAGRSLPEGVLTCNFPRPGTRPALLQHSEVRTFFHEFGHLLHHVLGGRARWAGLSGTRTEVDFVEAPAQVLEEWAWSVESLQRFAHHIDTDAPLPADLISRMRRADSFGKGLWVRQQLFYAAVSLNLHAGNPEGTDSTASVLALQERYLPFRAVNGTYAHLAFTQLDGDYSALYYAYLWSLVIARDLLTPFEEHGLMDVETAHRYRDTVLAPGGSKDAADLVRDFLGRGYDFGAYSRWLEGR